MASNHMGLFVPGVLIIKKSLKSSKIVKITTTGANNTRMELGQPFLLRIFTFSYLHEYLVENPI